jgi:hypothetical protein
MRLAQQLQYDNGINRISATRRPMFRPYMSNYLAPADGLKLTTAFMHIPNAKSVSKEECHAYLANSDTPNLIEKCF